MGCLVASRHCVSAVQRACDVGIRRPRQETYRRRTMRRRSWLAAMRPQVAARESCFLWRRTDDGRSSCVFCTGERPAKVVARGHYGLGVCTDETSADTLAKKVPARERCRRPSTGAAICTVESVWRDVFARSAVSEGFQEGTALVGLAATNPTCCVHRSPDAEGHAVPVRRVIPRRSRSAGGGQLPAARLLVLRQRLDQTQGRTPSRSTASSSRSTRSRSANESAPPASGGGLANLQYIRYRNWFLLLATEGHHPFKQQERNQIRDCRRVPIKFEGYSISYRRSGVTPKGGGPPKWHACVRIDPPTYKQLKAFFRDRACHRSVENLAADFARVPYARYAPVRRQLLDHPPFGQRSPSQDGIRTGAALSPASASARRDAFRSTSGRRRGRDVCCSRRGASREYIGVSAPAKCGIRNGGERKQDRIGRSVEEEPPER